MRQLNVVDGELSHGSFPAASTKVTAFHVPLRDFSVKLGAAARPAGRYPNLKGYPRAFVLPNVAVWVTCRWANPPQRGERT